MLQYILIAASALMLAGFGINEATHGGMAEAMGLGHQHMLDHGGYHCTGPGEQWERHVDHMHDQNGTHCGNGHMQHHGGMMR